MVRREDPDMGGARCRTRGRRTERSGRTGAFVRNAGGRRILLVVLMTALGLAALRDFARLGPGLPWRTMDDFPDFYCAGWTLDGGASPYTYEPLHACEHRVNTAATFRGMLFASNPGVAVPAPQPPFDFVPFTMLARLPFGTARAVDAFAIILAVALCVYALAALRVAWQLSAAALAMSTAFVELNTGQIVPFALLALVLAGLALAHRRDAAAGVLAALTAIEPTVGVPVVATTLLFVPRARAAALGTIVLLAIVSLAIGGPHDFVLYFTRVLPAHAASEVHFPYQYSLTYVAAFFGLPPAAAQLVGALGYCAAVVLALAIARPASAALSRRDLLVFIPALCAVAGGAFLHQEEICFALPALLVLTTTLRGRAQIAAACRALRARRSVDPGLGLEAAFPREHLRLRRDRHRRAHRLASRSCRALRDRGSNLRTRAASAAFAGSVVAAILPARCPRPDGVARLRRGPGDARSALVRRQTPDVGRAGWRRLPSHRA